MSLFGRLFTETRNSLAVRKVLSTQRCLHQERRQNQGQLLHFLILHTICVNVFTIKTVLVWKYNVLIWKTHPQPVVSGRGAVSRVLAFLLGGAQACPVSACT